MKAKKIRMKLSGGLIFSKNEIQKKRVKLEVGIIMKKAKEKTSENLGKKMTGKGENGGLSLRKAGKQENGGLSLKTAE